MNSLEASRGSRHRLRGGRMLRRERGEKGGVRTTEGGEEGQGEGSRPRSWGWKMWGWKM